VREENPRTVPTTNVTLATDGEARELLLSTKIHLMEIHIYSHEGTDSVATETSIADRVYGDFCELNFAAQKQDPTNVPMFRHLVQQSPACATKRYRVNIGEFVRLAKTYDAREGSETRALPVAGAIFHQSRCGSTLISNALQCLNPAEHRVYSEAQPETVVNLCGDAYQHCSKEQAVDLLRNVIYLMSRTNDKDEQKVFFKFHADNSRLIEVFQIAYPTTPWLFVFRNPVHILVSQFKEGKSLAKCGRNTKDPPVQVLDILRSKGYSPSELTSMGKEFACAATLASYSEAALVAKERAPRMGTLVHYPDLPDILVEDTFPNTFGLLIDDEQRLRIRSIATMYSKASNGRARPYVDDSNNKEHKATDAIREAANLFLDWILPSPT
jgi:hypothetical protein